MVTMKNLKNLTNSNDEEDKDKEHEKKTPEVLINFSHISYCFFY